MAGRRYGGCRRSRRSRRRRRSRLWRCRRCPNSRGHCGWGLWGLFLLSLAVKKKAWSLRTASAILSGGSIGALVAVRPDYLAVLGALLPLFLLVLLYGAPFSRRATGPGWRSAGSTGSGGLGAGSSAHHPPTKILGAVDSYLILAEAVTYQLTEQSTGVVLISFVLSAPVITIATVAAGVEIDLARRALRATGLASQVYLAAVDDTEPVIRILSAVVCGLYAIPATL